MMAEELKENTAFGFKDYLSNNEITPTDTPENIHVRNLPYYFETYWHQRPGVSYLPSHQSKSENHDGNKATRFDYSSRIPMKSLNTKSAGTSRRELHYSRCDTGTIEKFNRNKFCMSATERGEHSSSQKLSSYETFLNYLVSKMGHRPELQNNAKQFIVRERYPDLPSFVYPKDLHPKFFWRDVRQPLDRLSRNQLYSDYVSRKNLQNQKRKSSNMQNSPSTPATDKRMDSINNQIMNVNSANGKSKKKGHKAKSHHSSRRKKKSRKGSKRKKKGSNNEKDYLNGLHDCKLEESDSGSSSDNGSHSDEDFNSSDKNLRIRRPKKEKKFNPGQKPNRTKEEAVEEQKPEYKEEIKENEPEKSNSPSHMEIPKFDLGTNVLASSNYKEPGSRMPLRQLSKTRSPFIPLKKNKIEPNKITEPETPMFTAATLLKKVKSSQKEDLQSWFREQIDFSLKPCRFELPIDSRKLEGTSPEKYLRTYCVVTSQFESLYKTVFRKYQILATQQIEYKNLEAALEDVAVNPFTKEKLQILGSLIELKDSSTIDYKLFSGMAALAERLTDSNIESLKKSKSSQDEIMMREYIEMADFSALEWKFKGVNLNNQMKTLLRIIAV